MVDTKRKVPNLRFKGFTNDWEQRKLNSFLVEYKKKTKINNQYPVLTSSRQGIFFQKDYYDGNQIASKNNVGYNIVPRDYFTYRHMSDDTIFHFNINTLCDYGIVSTLYPVFTTINQLSSSWLYYYLNYGNDMKRYALLQKQGGSRTYMYFSKLKNMLAHIPSVKEQDSIAKILLKIDKLITLQQRKLELLSLIKKKIIKHLFKLKNSDSLNLKFKTSCSQWNSKKLGEIAKFINGRAFKQSELLNKGKYPVLRVGNFYTNDKWFYSDLNLNKNKYADKGDLLYTWSATFGPHIWKGPKVIFHYHIWKIDFDPSTVNKTFLFYFLEADKENLLTNSNGSTMIHITKSNMENKIINLPQFSIQQNIGTFLSNLDYLINQEKIKSKQLIQLKRFLLQNMFI